MAGNKDVFHFAFKVYRSAFHRAVKFKIRAMGDNNLLGS